MEILSSNTEAVLYKFSYYKKLSTEAKRRFVYRLDEFIQAKDFEGREGLEVTDEMKITIAAAAIQLTFGLSGFKLKHFKKILLYPDTFYSPFSQSANVGEANPNGILVFSWKAIKDGQGYNSKNVALHEFAHAINLSDEMGVTTHFFQHEADPVFSYYYDRWYAVIRKFLHNPESEERKFFRQYAGKNLHEFFAVATEYFFEKPEEYQQTLPELFIHHCCLLGQNPLNTDYKLSKYDVISGKPFKQSSAIFEPTKSTWVKILDWTGVVFISFILLVSFDFDFVDGIFFCALFLFAFFNLKKKIVFIVSGGNLILRHKAVVPYETNTFLLSNILSIDYYKSGKNNNYLKIVSYRDQSIQFDHIKIYYELDSLKPLFKHLFEEYDIVVKNEGKIFIP